MSCKHSSFGGGRVPGSSVLRKVVLKEGPRFLGDPAGFMLLLNFMCSFFFYVRRNKLVSLLTRNNPHVFRKWPKLIINFKLTY